MEQLLTELMVKPEAELNEYIDTGMFNEIIKGYLVLALQNIGQPKKDILSALNAMESAFDDADAEQARQAYKEIYF